MTQTISISFTYSQAEYVLAIKRHYRTTVKTGRDLAIGLLMTGGGVYLLGAGSLTSGWALVVLGGILLALVLYVSLLLPRMIYSSQPKLKDEYSLEFSDQGIRFRTAGVDSQLRWDIYQSWLRDDEFYIMYLGRQDMSVIPRRALSDADDQRLCALLESKVGPSA